ncbi:MAG: Vps62-related protein [Planctomycetes bacterium]|nr:Vps62-related protein [Planctomycetota bacterium]MCB9920128.1 Vps62-related protein [Planctomycetota bacterium]
MNQIARLLFLPLVAATAPAQTALFSTSGIACSGAVSSRTLGSTSVSLSSTKPILGSTYTITLRGPANCSGVLMFSSTASLVGFDLTSSGMPGCRSYLTGTQFTIPIVFDGSGIARTTMQAAASAAPGTTVYFQAKVLVPGVNAASQLTSSLGIARLGTEPNLTDAEIRSYAPVVRIHPREEYRPMSPDEFITKSRFRHHRGWQSDQGFHRTTQTWVTTNSYDPVYFGIPTNVLAAYTLHSGGKNRRPRDSNCGDSYNVFLQSAGRLTGPTAPNGVVPAYYHYRRIGRTHQIQFWWFCGFNDSFASFNHQGDWEHVTVHVERDAIVGVFFAAHENGSFVRRADLKFVGARPLVYMAKGSHASYRAAGSYMAGIDSASDGGAQWDTSRLLRPLATQPWRDYAGAWGEVGSISTTTGPLGPWHKRNDA